MKPYTKTPWHVTESIHNGKVYISEEGKDNGRIALCEKEDDAAFIVHACNMHDELVRDLKDACRLLRVAKYAMTGTITSRILETLERAEK